MSTRKVRVKKLSVKTLLPVLRETDIDAAEYESLTTETQIATGVEAAEETVSHIFAHIAARYHVTHHVICLGTPGLSTSHL